MAASDVDSMGADKRVVATASDNLVGYGADSNLDDENRATAAAAGVIDAAYINYDVALDAYAARPDIEDLAHKNARDMPADFADASFMRTVDGQAGSGSSL